METTCSGCGKGLAQAEILYTADARPVCAACSAQADLLETDKRAAGNIVKAGWAALGAGALAFVGPIALLGIITYFFVASSVIGAVFAIQGLARGNERFTQHLSEGQRVMGHVCAVGGMILSALTLLGVPGLIALRMLGRG